MGRFVIQINTTAEQIDRMSQPLLNIIAKDFVDPVFNARYEKWLADTDNGKNWRKSDCVGA